MFQQFPFAALFVVALAATMLSMPVARRVGARFGLLDHPDRRKLQTSAVPRTGGIGMLVGLTAGTALLLHLSAQLGIPVTREIVAIFVGALVLHVTGVLDDLFDVPARVKLVAQVFAAAVPVTQGLVVDHVALPGGTPFELGPLGVPLTVFFVVGFVNAINLVDGLDGLASGVAAIGALTLAIAGVLQGNAVLAALSLVMLGSVLGFLPFNLRRRGKVFLGDAGSMLLGYLLAVTAIAGARFCGNSGPIAMALACASMPILDTATTIARRARSGRGLFRADSMHLHHRMVRAGLSPRRTVLAILSITLFAAGQALVTLVEGLRPIILCATLSVALAAIQLVFRRSTEHAEPDTGLREILLFLIGAQEGRGRLMDEKLAIAEVIAAVQGASRRSGLEVVEGGSAPRHAEPVARSDEALRREAVGAE